MPIRYVNGGEMNILSEWDTPDLQVMLAIFQTIVGNEISISDIKSIIPDIKRELKKRKHETTNPQG